MEGFINLAPLTLRKHCRLPSPPRILTQGKNTHGPRLITCPSVTKTLHCILFHLCKKLAGERKGWLCQRWWVGHELRGRECEGVECGQVWPTRQGRRIGPGSEAVLWGRWGASLSVGIEPVMIYCISLSDRPVMHWCQEERRGEEKRGEARRGKERRGLCYSLQSHS